MDDIEFLPDPPTLPQRRRRAAPVPAGSRVFVPRASSTTTGTLQCVGGALLICFAIVMFVVHLLINSNQFAMHGSTTLPILLAIGLISAGASALRSPSQIVVDPEGIDIIRSRGNQRIPWSEIGLANSTTTGMMQRRQLVLCDVRGKPIVSIGDTFPDFGAFVKLVQEQVRKKPDSVAEPLRLKKARRMAFVTFFGGVLMAAAAATIGWNAWDLQRGQKLLASSSVEGEAKIVRRFVAPNGTTHRLEYEVTGDNGQTDVRNIEVESSYWEELEGATTVPVRYVPSEPGYSELLRGEVSSSDDLGTTGAYTLTGLAVLMTLFLFSAAIMQFKGYDYGTNPETGKTEFYKLGA